jgi:hypothetical protein
LDFGSRLGADQGVGTAALGTVYDVSGLSGIVAGGWNVDAASGQDLHLAPIQQGEQLGGGIVTVGMWAAAPFITTAASEPAAPRLPQDVNVDPNAPPALPWPGRTVGSDPAQNAQLVIDINDALANGADPNSIRVNQQQVNAAGDRVGINRPDLQYTDAQSDQIYIEYDTPTSGRGPGHAVRLLANDPDGTAILKTIPGTDVQIINGPGASDGLGTGIEDILAGASAAGFTGAATSDSGTPCWHGIGG